MQQHKKLSYC